MSAIDRVTLALRAFNRMSLRQQDEVINDRNGRLVQGPPRRVDDAVVGTLRWLLGRLDAEHYELFVDYAGAHVQACDRCGHVAPLLHGDCGVYCAWGCRGER
jgi:hypothetical protein